MKKDLTSTALVRCSDKVSSGIALGGIGTGGVEMWADGRLYFWNIFNNRPWATMHADGGPRGGIKHSVGGLEPTVGDTDFFIRIARPGKRPVYRWLFTDHGHLQLTASHFWRNLRYFFIKCMDAIEYQAEYPFAYLRYVDEELPIEIGLRAWTPLIPHDVKNSALPLAYFDFEVENKTDEEMEVSIVWQMSNRSGYGADKVVQDHELTSAQGAQIITMKGSLADMDHDTSGSMSIWAEEGEGKTVTAVEANPYMQNLIWPIHRTGGLEGPLRPEFIEREELVEEPDVESTPNKGWLCVQQQLGARATEQVRFGMSWFYPNHISINDTWVGHVYANWFDNSTDAAEYALKNYDDLLERSLRLPERVMQSTMPDALKLSLLDQLSTLTKSTHFIKNGRFGLQEGHGCCAFNTVDVDHYSSYALSYLFPELRKTAMDMAQEWHDPETGRAFHGYPGTVEIPEEYTDNWHRHDCSCQYVLQVYRDAKISGNKEMLEQHYEDCKRAIAAISSLDDYDVGLPRIDGHITYDHWSLHGLVTYMCGVYLASVLALKDMAEVMGDEETAQEMEQRAERGAESFQKYLRHDDRYLLFYVREDDEKESEESCCKSEGCGCRPDEYIEVRDNGVMADALNGNGTAAVMGLGEFLPREHYRDYLEMVMRENWRPDVKCIVNGSYPDVEGLDEWPFENEWPFAQWHTPWTGTEHFFVSQLYVAGMEEEADMVIAGVLDRHVREGMRWDHTECNNHYARPLSIWSAYAARLGLDYDGWRSRLTIDPRTAARQYEGLLLTGTCLGQLQFAELKTRTRLVLELDDGRLPVKTLVLPAGFDAKDVDATLGEKPVDATLEQVDGRVTVTFRRKVTARPGKDLSVVVSGRSPRQGREGV